MILFFYIVPFNELGNTKELIAVAKTLMANSKIAGAYLYCPNCHENLGKQSECESDFDCVRGKKCRGYCGTCGKEFIFRAEYGA